MILRKFSVTPKRRAYWRHEKESKKEKEKEREKEREKEKKKIERLAARSSRDRSKIWSVCEELKKVVLPRNDELQVHEIYK
jgi:hypothetical protein